ncbi:uncharacterized protein BDW43DRAFT_306301 [Aspergillus alliaceus]|uniref:uncharacterized protein n=1 Tax=Petromyces alliaceus TaxID=209559 RepID=UPI0012A67BB5|nr:uncharacterized protein BDW43DRAFT_306301 [Aspergillus alliaceus]KAB8238441.1 hypothetical protein BDW43DRAFT_306301 [Aspergillus alliaceus]
MCQMVIFWHACTHLVVSYMTCAFEEARNHEEQTATTALMESDCWICQQHGQPCRGEPDTMKRLLMTVQNMECILGVSADESGFLDMVARFYARGDHKRWLQPGVAKAKYTKEDPYVRGLEIQTYLCTRGRSDFHMNPGYAFDIMIALFQQWDRLDYSNLNWSMAGYRRPSDFFFVSSNMIGLLSPDGQGLGDKPKTGVRHVAQRSGHLSNGNISMPAQCIMASIGTGEQGYNHIRTGSLARPYVQGQSIQPPMDAQASSVHNAIGNPGLLRPWSDGRPCEAPNRAPITKNQYTHHVFRSLSPLGEPGPSMENHTQALDERATHQVGFHVHTNSLNHPLFAAECDGDVHINGTSHGMDLNHHTKTDPITYNNTFPIPDNTQQIIPYCHSTPRGTINQIYPDPDISTSRHPLFPEKTAQQPINPTEDPLFPTSLENTILIPRSPTTTFSTIDPSMLDLSDPDQLQFSGPCGDGTCGKGKQPIGDISQLEPHVLGGFGFPLHGDSMDFTKG